MKIRTAVYVALVCVGPSLAFAGQSPPHRTSGNSFVDALFRPLDTPHAVRRAPVSHTPVHTPLPRPRPFSPSAEALAVNSVPDQRQQVLPSTSVASEPEARPSAQVVPPYLTVAAGP
jgi:hypothetical protein